MKSKIVLFLVIILLGLSGCNTTEPLPPPPDGEKPTLELTIEDVSCIEAWVKLTTTNLELPATITLKQFNPTGDTISHISILNTKDSLLYIDSLLPNTSYQYQTSSIPQTGGQYPVYSNELSVTTIDTTSHAFTFEMITFGGEISSSVLYDVAIINENNIWAVGEIWIADTSSLGYTKYNAVHWDGTEWKLHRVMFYTVCGQSNLTAFPAKAIFVLNENDIWIAMDGDQIARMNGTTQVSTQCLPFSFVINKLWGSSSSNLYAVGNNGNIAYYNGTSWQRIASGTTLNINDIWGDYNEKTQEWEILAVAGNILQGTANFILKIINGSSTIINNANINWPLRSLWFNSANEYYVSGSGIYQKHSLNESIWLNDIYSITTYSINRIRGSAINDIIATGGAGEVIHFNGYSWKSFIENTQLLSGNYYGCSIKGNKIIAVGQNNPMAVITIGTR